MKKYINWKLLLKLVYKYREEAEKCLDSKIYLAGLVSVRATLETLLQSRFLLELFEWSEEELKECNIVINGNKIEYPQCLILKL